MPTQQDGELLLTPASTQLLHTQHSSVDSDTHCHAGNPSGTAASPALDQQQAIQVGCVYLSVLALVQSHSHPDVLCHAGVMQGLRHSVGLMYCQSVHSQDSQASLQTVQVGVVVRHCVGGIPCKQLEWSATSVCNRVCLGQLHLQAPFGCQ